LDNESLKGGSRYPNSDKSYKSSNTEVPRYPNRGGGLSIRTSSDKICTDNESLKGGLGIQTIWIQRPQCICTNSKVWSTIVIEKMHGKTECSNSI